MADSATTQTVITVSGKQITFSDLNLDERVLDSNLFSFSWTPEGNDGSLSSIIKFKDDNLSKATIITFNDGDGHQNHIFKGIITQINSRPGSDLHVSFQVEGNGMFCKKNGILECNSFYKKTLKDIIKAVGGGVEGATLLINAPKQDGTIQYIVQYNQTSFDFIKMLAIRYGEWMYYTGDTLVFGGTPSNDPVKLRAGQDVANINIHAHAAKANDNAFGFDVFMGRIINANEKEHPENSPLLVASNKAANNVFVNNGTGTYFSGADTEKALNSHNKLQQQAAMAGSVFISATSHNSKLTVGTVISITDQQDTSGKQFIIVEIHHSANNNHGYNNHFTAIPAQVKVPHYTNPSLFARASTQPAIVKENEDTDGHDRIKVTFPWMKQGETTPWIQVLTPHAGKNKGFRWIPEKEEEVMIDFIDNNAERPVMVGAMYTDQNKSGIDQKGNNIKLIGTRSGRMLKMDDEKGTLELMDDPKSGNYIGFTKSSDNTSLKISSGSDDNNFSTVTLQKENKISIGVKKGGSVVVSMEYDSDAKKITIKSLGSIEITADQDITLSGNNITLNAKQKLSMEGKLGGVEMKGLSIKESADTTYEVEGKTGVTVKGGSVQITGQAMAKLDGGGMTIIKGGVVMIN